MNVSKAGQYQRMQRSHRKLFAAGVSAIVLLGSADGVQALAASPSKNTFDKDASQNQLTQKFKTYRINTLENLDPEPSGHEASQVSPLQSSVTPLLQDSALHSDINSGIAADILHRYGTLPSGQNLHNLHHPATSQASNPSAIASNPTPIHSESDASPANERLDTYSIDPELKASINQLLESAETLAAENSTQVNTTSLGRMTSRAEQSSTSETSIFQNTSFLPSRGEGVETTNNIATPELIAPSPEFIQDGMIQDEMIQDGLAQATELDDEPGDESQGDFLEDELLEEETLDEETLEEAFPGEGTDGSDIDPDQEILTEAEALIAPPPDYLLSDPNPLFVPTRPEDVSIIGTQPLTLEQALELARLNSRDLQTALLNLDGARADLREAQAERFPNLSVGTDITHTDRNPAVEPTDLFGNPIEQDNNTTTLNGDVTLSYNLFTSGGRNASIRASERAVRLQELQVEVITEDIRQDVTTAYYDLQQADEEIRIAQADLEEALTSLRDAEARERAGVGTRFDRLQAEVEVANSQQDLRIAISNQQIARRALADLLSLPSGFDISAADDVEVAGVWPLTLEESIIAAFRNRAEPEQQLVQREIDQQQRRIARSQTLPQLSVFGRYSFNDLLDETNSAADEEALSVGAQLTWLLFDGGASRAAARGEKIDEQIAETAFADALDSIRFQVETAFSQLGANFENIQTAQTAVEVAQESLRLARLRFQAGVGIQSDVITAQSDLTDAELNLVRAILDYNRALVDIQRAVSNLDGDLADVP
jgi:OMF family outer membrane factor